MNIILIAWQCSCCSWSLVTRDMVTWPLSWWLYHKFYYSDSDYIVLQNGHITAINCLSDTYSELWWKLIWRLRSNLMEVFYQDPEMMVMNHCCSWCAMCWEQELATGFLRIDFLKTGYISMMMQIVESFYTVHSKVRNLTFSQNLVRIRQDFTPKVRKMPKITSLMPFF